MEGVKWSPIGQALENLQFDPSTNVTGFKIYIFFLMAHFKNTPVFISSETEE